MKHLIPLLGISVLAGCSNSGPPIDMTVPKGFTGPIWIIHYKGAPELELANGRYRATIPSNGVLRVRSFSPFERWHEFTFRYDDGSPLPYLHGGTEKQEEEIALRGGNRGTRHWNGRDHDVIFYYVGTQRQTSRFLLSDQAPPDEDD